MAAPHELMACGKAPRGKSTTFTNNDKAWPKFMTRTAISKNVGFEEDALRSAAAEQAVVPAHASAQCTALSKAEGSLATATAPFGSQVDNFMALNDCPADVYFRESEKHMQELQLTLTKFTETLVKRGLTQELGIEIKKPNEYTMQNVIDIAQRVQQRHASSDGATKNSLGLIRKCFRQAIKKQGILNNLLNFIPSDSYSSVICGGFTLILGVRLSLILSISPYF